MNDVQTARSYRGSVVGDNMVVSINFKWALQLLALMGTIVLSLDLQPLKTNWWKQIAKLGVYLISIAWKRSGKEQNWKVSFHSMKKNLTSTHSVGEKRSGNES